MKPLNPETPPAAKHKTVRSNDMKAYIKSKMLTSNFADIWAIMHEDLKLLRKDNSQMGQRNYIKLLISLVDGMCFTIRNFMLNDLTINISQSDRGKIERSKNNYEINSDDVEKMSNPRFMDIVKTTFLIFGKYYGKQDHVEKWISNHQFENLRKTYNKRNNITHPKNKSDLMITENNLENARSAHEYFHSFLLQIFEGVLIESK